MKKVSLLFVVAVLLPSLVLAWLAARSLRDQQFLLERQESLLCQQATDTLAQEISDALAQRQQDFAAQVEALVGDSDPRGVGGRFDADIRQRWPLAEVGFCVTLTGKILSPSPVAREQAKEFYSDNGSFLGNRESVEVYNNLTINSALPALGDSANGNFASSGAPQLDSARFPAAEKPADQAQSISQQKISRNEYTGKLNYGNAARFTRGSLGVNQNQAGQQLAEPNYSPGNGAAAPPAGQQTRQLDAGNAAAPSPSAEGAQPIQSPPTAPGSPVAQAPAQNAYIASKSGKQRKVMPQSADFQTEAGSKDVAQDPASSRLVSAEGEFRQLIGDGKDGMLARFLQNKLKLMVWHRLARDPNYVFGAQLDLGRVVQELRPLVLPEHGLQNDICVALLDDNARPVALSRDQFSANWKRPFVATEIGEALPHWEIAAYLINPDALTQAAHTAKLTLGLLVAMLVFAIGVGSWLVVRSLNAELRLARQKTDFVSNVSHELKTPLTSIRMFSELLAEGRVADEGKRRSYLNIITAEAARLTRLINNVLDFSRMERGEKKYNFQPCSLTEIARATAETFRPHLESAGFKFDCELPSAPIPVRGDADALSQIIVNLLSNAEKYSNGGKEIALKLAQRQSPLPHAEVRVLDRGPGVPRGCEQKVFEKFYRAHDSLGSGIQGSGLGLTIARQIARAHGGDVTYESRDGGGSCFILRLPVSIADE